LFGDYCAIACHVWLIAHHSLYLIPFEITDYLDGEEAIAEYLSQVQADGYPDELQRALGYIARPTAAQTIACAKLPQMGINHS
jgi:DNA-binding phage protein